MIRSVKIASPLNKGKLKQVRQFLETYQSCVNYFIVRLWSEKKVNGRYLEKEHIEEAKRRFNLTARLIQCAGKQALAIVKSQHKKSKRQRRMPRFRRFVANLDNRFWKITDQCNSFEWIRLQSGFTFYLPFKKTRVWNHWANKGFSLSKSIRLVFERDKLFIEFFFEKEAPELKTIGNIEGLDLGYVNLAVCSDGQVVGERIKDYIKGFDKREKHTHQQITQQVFHELKKLDLSKVKTLVIENLKKVKHKTRGMFPREHNRHLSHWLYAKAIKWLEQRCEEEGIQLLKVSPWKTSQFCRFCGNWDRRSRRGEEFACVHCGHRDSAEHNAAENLKLLGLAGVYSLRLLKIPCNI
ncbi:zinc ribbon domain-containing protein [Dehalococcoidia bacterium]|nr:zinc ribbon domain-containing protein [Dehalococcoidia bacterium]